MRCCAHNLLCFVLGWSNCFVEPLHALTLKTWSDALQQVSLLVPSGKGDGRCSRTRQVQPTQTLRRTPFMQTLGLLLRPQRK